MESSQEVKTFTVFASPKKQDEDGYITVWDLAAVEPGGGERNLPDTRYVASRLLNFLAKNRYPYALVSQHDADSLDQAAEREADTLFRWTPESDKVDFVAQYLKVPAGAITRFLRDNKFDANESYNPRKSVKVQWFEEDWRVE